jgi:transcriptional regulator of acetoin/glycerol metabolism
VIVQSHQRCAALGLSRIERPDLSPLGRPDLNLVRERNLRLHDHAAPVMEMLFDQIAGTESMVVLCDSSGTILHSVGDDDFLARAQKVALQPGANWSEQSKGTNAIGTALIDEVPTLVHADEHFMHANHFLTCSAAPILDPRGNILGVLDVTGDHRSYHQHTMALVKMSARMIENHWLSDDYRNAMRLHFHSRAEFIGTLMEGILAVAPTASIVGANRSALEQLGLSGAALRHAQSWAPCSAPRWAPGRSLPQPAGRRCRWPWPAVGEHSICRRASTGRPGPPRRWAARPTAMLPVRRRAPHQPSRR